MRNIRLSHKRILCAMAWVVMAIASSGCVERRYTIRSNPPGALVYVNGEEIGTTPVSRSFTYYGDREITLIQDGFETQRLKKPLKAPWWDNLFTEFFSENLIPWTLRDEREMAFDMQPVQNLPVGDLMGRAEGLRAEGKAGTPAALTEPRRWFRWFREPSPTVEPVR
ncbi:MAG: PEGA domain-containing protein [Planctomycetota bacterium]